MNLDVWAVHGLRGKRVGGIKSVYITRKEANAASGNGMTVRKRKAIRVGLNTVAILDWAVDGLMSVKGDGLYKVSFESGAVSMMLLTKQDLQDSVLIVKIPKDDFNAIRDVQLSMTRILSYKGAPRCVITSKDVDFELY